MDPNRLGELLEVLHQQVEAAQAIGAPPVVLCSSATRRHLKALTVHALPILTVLSYNEILPDVRVEPVGMARVA
jgi:flagellar biosynthesis protein FlhA